ncbi:MAG: cellulose binding domain-containing protein, partial [Pseudomonadota bacterium]
MSLTVNNGDQDSQPFDLNIDVAHPAPATAACSYRLANEWGSGFTGEVSVTNGAEGTIDGWFVTVDYPDGSQLTGTWNGQQGDGPPYRIDNANHNRVIAPGETVSFGFNAQRPAQGAPNTTPVLGGICGAGSGNRAPLAHASASSTQGEAP